MDVEVGGTARVKHRVLLEPLLGRLIEMTDEENQTKIYRVTGFDEDTVTLKRVSNNTKE